MACYVFVEITINNPDNMGEYMSKVSDTVTAHGGKYLIRAGDVEVVEGNIGEHPTKVMLEFPDKASARAWYDSGEYQAIIGNRLENSTANMLLIEGL